MITLTKTVSMQNLLASRMPWYMGVSHVKASSMSIVYAPIPLNFIIRLVRNSWRWLIHFGDVHKLDEIINDERGKGYKRGWGDGYKLGQEDGIRAAADTIHGKRAVSDELRKSAEKIFKTTTLAERTVTFRVDRNGKVSPLVDVWNASDAAG